MLFLKLIVAFAPWLAFLFIEHGSLFRLQLGLIIALVLSVALGVARVHRGVILWVGLVFFSSASLTVIAFNNMWAVRLAFWVKGQERGTRSYKNPVFMRAYGGVVVNYSDVM